VGDLFYSAPALASGTARLLRVFCPDAPRSTTIKPARTYFPEITSMNVASYHIH
jgi:hypothetical protein